MTRETNNRSNPEDVIRHEYGHTKQLEQLGIVNYALCIGLPLWQQWGTGEYYSKPWRLLQIFMAVCNQEIILKAILIGALRIWKVVK